MTVGDYGEPITLRVPGVDLTVMDTRSIVVRKPDGTMVTWTPTTVAADQLTYLLAQGDLDQAGVYCVELALTWGILVDPAGQVTSSIGTFQVAPAL